jgi:hypothetical protein
MLRISNFPSRYVQGAGASDNVDVVNDEAVLETVAKRACHAGEIIHN